MNSNVFRLEDSNGNILDAISGSGGGSSSYNAVEKYWESTGEGVETHTFDNECTGLAIVNLGESDILVTVGDVEFTVGVGEAFEDNFKPFSEIQIVANNAYKAIVRTNTALNTSSGGSSGAQQIKFQMVLSHL